MENERQRLSTQVQIRILENEIEHLKEDMEDVNKTLYNDGQGMVYDVKQLKHNNQSSSSRAAAIINVISVLISFVVMILMIIEKTK